MLVKIEARILIFPDTDFHFPSTSVPPGTFLGSASSCHITINWLTDWRINGPIDQNVTSIGLTVFVILTDKQTHKHTDHATSVTIGRTLMLDVHVGLIIITTTIQLMPMPSQNNIISSSFTSRLVLSFWYRLTHVVLEKRPLNGCSTVAVVTTAEESWQYVYTPGIGGPT